MNQLVNKIRSRGYWRVVIRPSRFEERRIADFSELYSIVQRTAVRTVSKYFPWLDNSQPPEAGADSVGQYVDSSPYLELWRFFQSGQFVALAAMTEDWLPDFHFPGHPFSPPQGEALGDRNVILLFTSVFEFAARLALTSAGDDRMHVEIYAHGLEGRSIYWGNSNWAAGPATISEFVVPQAEVRRDTLVAEPKELAVKRARELFQRFNYNRPLDQIHRLQDEFCR